MQYLALKRRVLGAWNYFLSFPEQFPQVLKAGNSIYMKFEHKKNIQQKLSSLYSFTTKNFNQYNNHGYKKKIIFCKIEQNVKLGRLTENVEL